MSIGTGSWGNQTFLYIFCQTPNRTSTKRLGFTREWLYTTHTNSMSAKSQLLRTWFWWNFKGSFLGTSWRDSNCHSDIWPSYIYPYKEYLSCYWPNFDETLKVGSWEHLEHIPTVLETSVHIRNISAVTDTVKGKVNARSRQCQGKVKARSRQGQGKVNARLRQG